MGMRIIAVLLLFLGTSYSAFSQEIGEETRAGQHFKIYLVEAGNTLYGLHVKYDVTVEEIIKANPSVKDGLKVGQKIYIPFVKTSTVKAGIGEEKYIIHIVEKQETVFGISRKYNCTVEYLIKLNPGIEDGLKVGQELKIPKAGSSTEKEPQIDEDEDDESESDLEGQDTLQETNYKVEFTDSIIDYTVQKGETLYSISRRFMVPSNQLIEVNNIKGNNIKPGQVLKIPLKQEHIKEIESKNISPLDSSQHKRPILVQQKDKYRVLVVLPLKLSENPKVISGMYDESTELNKLTDLSVEFVMGAQMAIDSLEKLGLSATFEFYDAGGSLEQLKGYLGESNKMKWDMIIGPFYPKLVEYAAQWGKTNKVPVVAVTKIPTQLLENNPYLLSMVPSDLTLIGGVAKYLAKHHSGDNIVMINGEDKTVKDRIEFFKAAFQKNLDSNKTSTLRMSSIGDPSGRNLLGLIDPKKENIFIYLSDNVQYVMKFINALNTAKNYSPKYGNADVVIVGLKEWNKIKSFNNYYKNRFDFHFAAPNYLNFDSLGVMGFTKEFRSRYGLDPSKFAFHGFDVVLSQAAYLLLGYNRNHGLIDDFDVQPLGWNNGRENASVFISMQKDFDLYLLEIISNINYFGRE